MKSFVIAAATAAMLSFSTLAASAGPMQANPSLGAEHADVTLVRGGHGHGGHGHGFGRGHGRGHHFGWHRGRHFGWHHGRGRHYGFYRGRHRGWM